MIIRASRKVWHIVRLLLLSTVNGLDCIGIQAKTIRFVTQGSTCNSLHFLSSTTSDLHGKVMQHLTGRNLWYKPDCHYYSALQSETI